MKIGNYTDDEILEFMTEGEGRGFLGRSMFDAMYFELERLKKERENDIKYNKYLQKELAKSNNIIKEVREYIKAEKVIKEGNTLEQITNYEKKLLEILDKEK